MERHGLAADRRPPVETLRALRSSPWARALPDGLADALEAIVTAAERGDGARAASLLEEHLDALKADARRWAESRRDPPAAAAVDAEPVTAMILNQGAGYAAIQRGAELTVVHDARKLSERTLAQVVPGFDQARVVRGSFGAALVAGPAIARRVAASRSRLRRGHGHRGSGRRARTGRVRAGCSPGRSRPRRRADDDEHDDVALPAGRRG